MWIKVDGRLKHVADDSREKFRTNISSSLLSKLQKIADENDTHVNYLIENGMKNLINHGFIDYDKKNRPRDRRQYKTSYDKDLLDKAKKFAKSNKLNMNDIIEHSAKFIQLEYVKKASYRYRIE